MRRDAMGYGQLWAMASYGLWPAMGYGQLWAMASYGLWPAMADGQPIVAGHVAPCPDGPFEPAASRGLLRLHGEANGGRMRLRASHTR